MIACVSHKNAARGIHGDPARVVEERDRTNPIVGAHCGARERDNCEVGVDSADFVVPPVSHKHVARGVHGDAVRPEEESGRADPIVEARCGAHRAAARERDDGAVGKD
jgi:hypothetical protein